VAHEPDIAAAAALLAEPARASIITLLSEGTARPAGELARGARLAASTVSGHLSRLLGARVLDVEQHGRHRYYRLADPTVVRIVESLATIAPAKPVRSLGAASGAASLTYARTCYDHLAGRFGVWLTDALVERGTLVPGRGGYDVSEEGVIWLEDLGVPVSQLRASRRSFARECLDWSERRHHVAGALGRGLAERLFALSWIERVSGSRAVRLTSEGRARLAGLLGDPPDASADAHAG
jgi:DNA-binding transcriptional ArsR family regulator